VFGGRKTGNCGLRISDCGLGWRSRAAEWAVRSFFGGFATRVIDDPQTGLRLGSTFRENGWRSGMLWINLQQEIRNEFHRDERRLRDRHMTPYSETRKRTFQALLAIAFMEPWVKGFAILFRTLGVFGKDPHLAPLNVQEWMLFAAEVLAPALILMGFYWKVAKSSGPPRPTRLVLCGWLFSAGFHAFMAERFSSQTFGMPFCIASAWAALMSGYLAVVCAWPSRIDAINETIKKARTEKRSLRELRMVALLILLWGVLHLLIDIQHRDSVTTSTITLTGNGYTLHAGLSDLGILVFAGLWLRKSFGRSLAILLSWFWLIGAAFLALRLFPFAGITVELNRALSDDLVDVPEGVLRAAVFPFLLLQLWQLNVLKRADVRALFAPRMKPPLVPAASLPVESAPQAHEA
jgi:hypothetical protein